MKQKTTTDKQRGGMAQQYVLKAIKLSLTVEKLLEMGLGEGEFLVLNFASAS